MSLQERINAFVKVGLFINRHFNIPLLHENHLHLGLNKVIETAFLHNRWFNPNFVNAAIQNIGIMLIEDKIIAFCNNKESSKQKTVAIICAGNIPMVGFHDTMCVLLSGHKVLLKLSSDDNVLLPFFIKLLVHYEPQLESSILFSESKLSNFDAVIATGSNNSSLHFTYYSAKYPHIIRKNRNSLAILTGNETKQDFKNLGADIFTYYGLGCRNVSKIFAPLNYSFNLFFESIIDFDFVIENNKYKNNYDYHRAIYLLEQIPFLDNNFLMLRENENLHSPVAVLHYQFYKDETELQIQLELNMENIQCIIGKNHIPFGYSQQPVISDFADNMNTSEFLLSL